MTDALTANASEAQPAPSRRLHPGLAFLAGPISLGLGYLYVGRINYAIVFLAVLYFCLFAAGWTGMATSPVGFYSLAAIVGFLWLAQVVHPLVLAWSRPVAPRKPYNRWWWYLAWFVGLNVASLPISVNRGGVLGYDHYYIPSGSMEPTVRPGDRIVVDAWRYRDVPPAFGDVVLCLIDGMLMVKRVVGVPGDTIELRGPRLIRNGSPVDEPYLTLGPAQLMRDVAPLALGADDFFVVGDNRANSNDSRYVGPLTREEIRGRVEHIYFSSSRGRVNWERFPAVLAAD